MCPAAIPDTIPAVCGPPRSHFLHPIVLTYTLSASDTPYSPPRNPSRPAIPPAIRLSGCFPVYITVLIKA